MREMIILACTECKRKNYNKDKNKAKHSGRVEHKKFCRFCRKHTPHKEGK